MKETPSQLPIQSYVMNFPHTFSTDNPKFESQFINMIKTNVLNPLTCTKLALEKMSKINDGIGGAIVNISSGSAFIQGSPVLEHLNGILILRKCMSGEIPLLENEDF